MNNFLCLIISILFLSFLTSCACNEPKEEYVKKQFSRLHKNDKLVKLKNTEVDPPCFYWKITYQDSLNNIKTENWQFWKIDTIDCNWRLVVLKD